jgi:hypothetical protein
LNINIPIVDKNAILDSLINPKRLDATVRVMAVRIYEMIVVAIRRKTYSGYACNLTIIAGVSARV